MRADKRLSGQVIQLLGEEIRDAGGNEVFALGFCNAQGLIARVKVLARGNPGSVLAVGAGIDAASEAEPADVLIHNHPSGFLTPSDNDLIIASRAAESGVGSFIIDNEVRQVYVVAEPTRRRARKTLDADGICRNLEEGGAIARRLPAYETRPSQLDLMRLIVRGFNEDALVAAEAGTGVGKSFAYLLPAMSYALLNEERIVISTATINLQQQLYGKDIPLVASALPSAPSKPIKAVLIKGRGNYLCRRRLVDALREPVLDDEENDSLRSINAWSETTPTGDRQDLAFLPPETLWLRVCSEADLCMGMRCPERERCFILSLRRECADARILVVNHHLLFADLAARHEGAGYDNTVVLPPYTRVIIDEAHTIEGAATSFFSKSFSRPGLFRQLGRLYRKRRAQPAGLLLRLGSMVSGGGEALIDDAAEGIQKIRETADALDDAALHLSAREGTFRLTPSREGPITALLFPCLLELRKGISALAGILRAMLEKVNPDFEDDPTVWEVKAVLRRLEAVGTICGAFMEYQERPGEVLWIEGHYGSGSSGDKTWAQFSVTPIDVAPSLRDALFEPNKTVVCVSATLTVADSRNLKGSFTYWKERSGVNLVAERDLLSGLFPSPFPYAKSVLLAAPRDAPLPEEAGYQAFVDGAAAKLAEIAGGSALILFTSYQSLRSAYHTAAPVLEKQGIRCLKQGDDDRSRLLRSFLDDESSVLFATDSFWEGVDAPGNTLRLVILCRLPFRTPNEPVFEARREALEKRGGNAFMDLSLPEAVMKFKQGFGRLMRRSGDYGVVAVLDGRILHKRYGEYFLRSLPETKTSFAEFDRILREAEGFLFPPDRPAAKS
ncbi:MAG: ATP-dependent DNA helicase DinG [Spirochaetaceae bacterium]|nr:ATP-dependent DNA helicase DinG [Spirochaetaceae bacterium]